MMKPKKLTLSRATLRSLTFDQMENVAGALMMVGGRGRHSDNADCSDACPFSSNGAGDCSVDLYSSAGC